MAPTADQQRLAGAIASALLLSFLLLLPFRHDLLPLQRAFIPIVDTILIVNGLFTAALLYAQFSVSRRSALLALASGYLFTALAIAAHLLTYPGAFAAREPFGASSHIPLFLYVLGHIGLPAAAIAYTHFKLRDEGRTMSGTARGHIVVSLLASTAAAVVLIWLVIAGVATSLRGYAIAPPLVALSGIAIALVWTRRSSALDLWVLLVLCAWLIEVLLLSMADSHSVVWYAARAFGIFGSGFVLLMMLYEFTGLHARLAISLAAQDREREERRATFELVFASMAHKLHQPLCAIAANASAASAMLRHIPANLQETRDALEDIAREAGRAGEIIDSTRGLFSGAKRGPTLLSIEQLIRETLELLRLEIEARRVVVRLQSPADLPAIRGNAAQLRQVLVNLISNALDSIAASGASSGLLKIRIRREAERIAIAIEDSGVGLQEGDAARIFDAFVTTKPNGMGLGLAICRSIIEAHGGQIWATPLREGGAVLHCTLPLAGSLDSPARSSAPRIRSASSALQSSHPIVQ